MTLAFIVALLAGLSTVVGGWLGTDVRMLRRDMLAASLAFAAGLMIAISVVEIAPAALVGVREVAGSRTAAWAWVAGALVLGVVLVLLIERVMPHGHVDPADLTTAHRAPVDGDHRDADGHHDSHDRGEIDPQLLRSGLLLAAVVGLHNLPEGLATFLTTLKQPTGGITLAIAIAIHNIPEGLAVAAPIYAATRSRSRALFWATISGLAEPFGAIVGYLLLRAILPEEWLILALALVAGMMLAVSFRELLPAARRYETHYSQSLVGFFLGAVVMVLSLQLLTMPSPTS